MHWQPPGRLLRSGDEQSDVTRPSICDWLRSQPSSSAADRRAACGPAAVSDALSKTACAEMTDNSVTVPGISIDRLVTFVLLIFMLEIRYFVTADGHQPFAEWFADLDPVSRAKVARVITRMEQGNLANVKSVGQGVLEYKIDFGSGYRVYFARDGETLLILLTGGTKKRQQRDINAAITYWQDYKRGKRGIR